LKADFAQDTIRSTVSIDNADGTVHSLDNNGYHDEGDESFDRMKDTQSPVSTAKSDAELLQEEPR